MTAPRFQGDPPTHFLSPLLEDAGVPHLFTTRNFPGVTAFRDPFPPLGPEAQPLLVEHERFRDAVETLRSAFRTQRSTNTEIFRPAKASRIYQFGDQEGRGLNAECDG